jgi:hypothetical protein
MTPFERLKPSIFATESGGDYNALYNYANRAGNPFAGFNLTGMTVDEALEFSSPSGPYAQYVKGQVGRVATPMGAYQVVGSTLAEAKKGLGLTGGEMMTEDLQDKIGQWIYKTQGPSAWEGLKGKDMATPMDRAREEELRLQMLASGTAPQAAPRAPLSALMQDRPQAAAAPQQRRSGFGGIMDYLGEQSPTTGLSRAEQFAAALDPLIMPEMRAGEAIRARGAQRMKRQSANKTVEYLRKNGYPEIAAMVEQNPAIASNVMSALLSKRLSPAETTGSMQNYEFLISQGLPKDQAIERAFGKGGSTFNLGPKTQISGDYVIVEDPTAEAGVRFIPIKGSKAEKEALAAAGREGVTQQQAAQKEAVISKSVDFLVEKIDAGGLFNLPETGIVGNLLGALGINQDAVDFKNELASVQANVAFDRLQQMRDASKNGGALGSVTEGELDLLMSSYGNLKQSTSPKKLKENLLYIEKIMTKIENDPVASSFYYNTSGGTAPLQTQATGKAQVGEPYP